MGILALIATGIVCGLADCAARGGQGFQAVTVDRETTPRRGGRAEPDHSRYSLAVC